MESLNFDGSGGNPLIPRVLWRSIHRSETHHQTLPIQKTPSSWTLNLTHIVPSTHLDVEEAGAGDVGDRGANLLPRMDHIDPEGVHSVPSDVVPVHSRDEHLALVIVHKQSANHVAYRPTTAELTNKRSLSQKKLE